MKITKVEDSSTEWRRCLDHFRIKFIHMATREHMENGRYPKVCILGPEEWYLLNEIAKAECTITDPKLVKTDAQIEYYGIKCYCGRFGIVFGSDHP